MLPGHAAWTVAPAATAGDDRRRAPIGLASTSRVNTAMVSKVSAAAGGTTTRDTGIRQYVSDPLSGAQTITGTIKGQIRALEVIATANARAQLTVRVVSRDGATVRGTLLALSTAALSNEYGTALANRKFPVGWVAPGTTLSSVSAQAGDRIVLDIGSRLIPPGATTNTSTLSFGDNSTDLPEDETTTVANNPWVELSQTLTFETVPELRSIGTYLTGTANVSAPSAVPAGVAADDIILAVLYKENTAAVTPPAGFSEFVNIPATDHSQHVFWKRATGADSGTYSFAWSGSNWREGYAVAYRNCVTSGTPYEALVTNFNNTASTTTPAVTITPATDNARIIWVATDFSGANPWTPPLNWQERTTLATLRDIALADRVWSGTGSTGNLTGTSSASGRMTVSGFALKPAGAGGAPAFNVAPTMFLVMD